jgi:RNA polymerase sigma-70 factor (ECF subfamily)
MAGSHSVSIQLTARDIPWPKHDASGSGVPFASAPDSGEARLIQAAIELDEDAWARLYARYREQIYAYIVMRVGDRHTSEDLTADVFVRAIAGIKKYEWRGTPLLAWLYRIAHNTTIDYRKQQARRSGREAGSLSVDIEDRVDSLSALDERNDMLDAIRALTENQQQVILLRFYGGLSTAQVSTVVNKPETAVKALQARGLRSLRRILSRREGSAHD